MQMIKINLNLFSVHVNGFFALGQDRKDLKWKSLATSGRSNDKTVNWNEHLLTKLLPLVYVQLFNFMKTRLQGTRLEKNSLDEFYGAWPNLNDVDDKWKQVLPAFNKLMIENRFASIF